MFLYLFGVSASGLMRSSGYEKEPLSKDIIVVDESVEWKVVAPSDDRHSETVWHSSSRRNPTNSHISRFRHEFDPLLKALRLNATIGLSLDCTGEWRIRRIARRMTCEGALGIDIHRSAGIRSKQCSPTNKKALQAVEGCLCWILGGTCGYCSLSVRLTADLVFGDDVQSGIVFWPHPCAEVLLAWQQLDIPRGREVFIDGRAAQLV